MPGETNLHQGQLLNGLPFLLSSFIGRERELTEVKQVLVHHRLVTLTGTGGCGKTRLALKVAADMQEQFADQVWLVELAALTEPALLPQTVALALGLREPAQGTWADALVGHLHSRKTLLVLDNCEHLITASATLVYTLLRICPQLSLLITSREALGIDGEITWLVPSLSLPPIQEGNEHTSPLSPEQLMGFDAIRLFIERTNDANTHFTLTDQNATLVTRLCQRLDGIPLAIELAAARMQILSLEQIVHRLDSSIRLLMRGKRSALPRHQTLQATIDWSYDMLQENERLLFRRLSVFAGGFTLEAVEAICAGGAEGNKIEQDEVLEILSSLVNKSLVIVAERAEEPRYRLFETVRQYAQEKLRAAGETTTIHWQHAGFFAQITDRAEPELKSGRRDSWIRYLNKEYDNLRTALGWLRDHSGEEGAMSGEAGLHMAGNLAWFWYFRSYLSEGRQWLEDMLAHTPDRPDSRARAVALFRIGSMSWVQGDYDISHARMLESVARWRAMGDKEGLAYALSVLGLVTQLHKGNQPLSRSLQEESLALFQEVGDTWGLALALYRLGDTYRLQQNDLESRVYFEESLILFRVVQDRWGIAIALQRLGMIASRQGNYALARAQLEECLTIQRRVGDKWIIAQTLSGLAHIVQRQGENEQAKQLLEESLELFRDIGDQLGITLTSSQLSYLSKTAPTEVEQLLSSALGLDTPPLRIFAFGQGRVYRAKDILSSSDWTYAKVRELFFFLASHQSRTRDQIGLALWPDASAAQLRSAFHDTLYHLRLALGHPNWIIFSKRSYTFNHQLPYWFDVEAFEAQVNHARQLQVEIPAQAIRAWEQAIQFYQGDFLQDMPFGDWCFARRETLRQTYQEALLALGELYTAENLYTQAVEIYRQAIAHDHYLETAHRALMQCYTYMGEKSRALRHYQDLVKWLRNELATQPDPETTALFEYLRGQKDLSYR